MIAYFALLSFVPLTFLALALLGLGGRADESSFLVREIKQALPETPIEDIVRLVRTVQRNAASLGIIGGAFLLWTSLSLFSVLESAFNIVYGRPNRSFLHGKGLAVALLMGGLLTLFVALLVGSFGVELLKEWAPWFIDNPAVAYVLSVAVSTLGVLTFLVSAYYLLTNERLEVRDVLPGALFATVLLQASFQVLPDVRPLRGTQPGAEDVRQPGDPAGLALRDVERDRVRRRAELVAPPRTRAGRRTARRVGLAGWSAGR